MRSGTHGDRTARRPESSTGPGRGSRPRDVERPALAGRPFDGSMRLAERGVRRSVDDRQVRLDDGGAQNAVGVHARGQHAGAVLLRLEGQLVGDGVAGGRVGGVDEQVLGREDTDRQELALADGVLRTDAGTADRSELVGGAAYAISTSWTPLAPTQTWKVRVSFVPKTFTRHSKTVQTLTPSVSDATKMPGGGGPVQVRPERGDDVVGPGGARSAREGAALVVRGGAPPPAMR